MDINSLVPFIFVSESNHSIDEKDVLIEIWQHIHTKKQFEVDRTHKLYRLLKPQNKKQDEFVNCPFINHLDIKLKKN